MLCQRFLPSMQQHDPNYSRRYDYLQSLRLEIALRNPAALTYIPREALPGRTLGGGHGMMTD